MNPTATGIKPQKTKIPGYNLTQVPQFTPEMMELLQKLIGGLGEGVGSATDYLTKLAGGDESMFEQLEAPAHRQFEKFLGQAGTRFSHLGAGDSSYFENAVSGAGSELAENLQSQRMGIRNDAIKSLLGNTQMALGQRPYEESTATPKEPSWFDKYLQFASANFGNASKAAAGGMR